ncbi:hypothetical protein RHSIM_Rhsim07G0051800 [Rhododendron simsii]|uniref:Uncharacterized protein n=1 Tax=Rhododendron simsii TaxID=118357 RepID=A0A834LIA5_RHOSS|nr:hypothetical protein RHSIM_Rhsim07G0051800 [Rhododendron simsii]
MTSLITNFINKDLPALVEKTVKKEFNAIEKAVSVAIAEAFQIQAQLQTSGKQALQETLKSSLEGLTIRAFEMQCKAIFEKVDTTFQKGMIDHATVAQQQFESTHSPLALALKDAINSASSLSQTLRRELYDAQRKLLALAATGANSNKIEAPLDLTKELSRLVFEHKYEEAFATALQRLDVSIVSWLCYQLQ